MKTTSFRKTLGLLTLTAMIAVPTIAFAADAQTQGSVHINNNGIIRVFGAQVTSVSGNIVNAVSTFKNTVLNWTVTTNASTTVQGGATTSVGNVHVGDKINITGALSALGATSAITASKIHDVTAQASSSLKARTGTVESINTASGTFTLKSDDKILTVMTNASTTWAKSGTTTLALSNLALHAKVVVSGVLNAEKTAMTAVKIVPVAVKVEKKSDDKKEKKDKDHRYNNGFFHGLKLGLRFHSNS